MTLIRLETIISAPLNICFDLSRSIDLHQVSMKHTNERAIAGKTTGLIEKGETVTWQAIHFGIRLKMKVSITSMDLYRSFTDEMIDGPFLHMRHNHAFSESENNCIMTDAFEYTTPFSFAGKLFDDLFLKSYMQKLLIKRNNVIKKIAESDGWKQIVGS
jgi:ligand-binding SRPBCC domain-containing protein